MQMVHNNYNNYNLCSSFLQHDSITSREVIKGKHHVYGIRQGSHIYLAENSVPSSRIFVAEWLLTQYDKYLHPGSKMCQNLLMALSSTGGTYSKNGIHSMVELWEDLV